MHTVLSTQTACCCHRQSYESSSLNSWHLSGCTLQCKLAWANCSHPSLRNVTPFIRLPPLQTSLAHNGNAEPEALTCNAPKAPQRQGCLAAVLSLNLPPAKKLPRAAQIVYLVHLVHQTKTTRILSCRHEQNAEHEEAQVKGSYYYYERLWENRFSEPAFVVSVVVVRCRGSP